MGDGGVLGARVRRAALAGAAVRARCLRCEGVREALRELNEANARSVSARVYILGDTVMVEQSVPADGLNAFTLQQACVAVGAVADDFGLLLAAMFDGHTPFPAEAEPVESEGA